MKAQIVHKEGLTFRQRVGKINWNALSSCNLRKIVENKYIDHLQKVLDNVTFSEFTEADVRSQSVETISKLVNVMQLIIEYLLCYQEVQIKTIKSNKELITVLKKDKTALVKERAFYSEDTTIYNKQLRLLRNALKTVTDMIKYPEDVVKGTKTSSRIIFDPLEAMQAKTDSPKSVTITEQMVVPIIQDALKTQQAALDEQKSVFVDELHHVVEGLRDMFNVLANQQTTVATVIAEKSNDSDILSSKKTLTSLGLQTSFDGSILSSPKGLSEKVDDGVLTAREMKITRSEEKLHFKSDELAKREAALFEKEKNFIKWELQLDLHSKVLKKEKENFADQQQKNEFTYQVDQFVKLGAKLRDDIPRRKAQRVGLYLLFRIVHFKVIFSSFSKWRKCTSGERDDVKLRLLISRDNDLLEYKQREADLVGQLRKLGDERRRTAEEQIRLHARCRELEAEKHINVMQAEAEMTEFLRRQIEVSSSSYNTNAPSRMLSSLAFSRSTESLYTSAPASPQKAGISVPVRSNSEVDNRLAAILPDDLIRISNEELALSQALLRIKSTASRHDDKGAVQDELAEEIHSKLQASIF